MPPLVHTTDSKAFARQHSSLYTCEITLHNAKNVPISDLNDLSSDPFFLLTLSTNPSGVDNAKRQVLTYRTHTERHTLHPTYECQWVVSGIPLDGFVLGLELWDEDPKSSDDKLGQAILRFPSPSLEGGLLGEGWKRAEEEVKIHKRRGSLKDRLSTFVAKLGTKKRVEHRTRATISIRIIGLIENQDDRRLFTVGPRKSPSHSILDMFCIEPV